MDVAGDNDDDAVEDEETTDGGNAHNTRILYTNTLEYSTLLH